MTLKIVKILKNMRSNPYTEKGISHVPCLRCGKPSSQQWQICSLNNKWIGICNKCDIGLNELILKFMRVKGRSQFIKRYKFRQTESR